jgi:hypothetical protein
MAVTLNANSSTGFIATSDTSGVLQLQTGGTTAVTVDASQNVTLAGTLTATGVTTVPAGTVSAPAITTTGDTNTGIFFPAADTIAFTEGGAESMRIDSSGNVGIGTSSPSAKLEINTSILPFRLDAITSAPTSQTAVYVGPSGSALSGFNGDLVLAPRTSAAGSILFYTGSGTSAERARIDSGGSLLVGTTSSIFTTTKLQVISSTTQAVGLQQTGGAANACITSWNTAASGTIYHISFADGASGLVRGSITTNGTGTTYGTASDYRLKHDIQPMIGALAKVAQLKPVTYKWNADDSESQGFIAHELQAVVPDCVVGEKDAVETYTDEDGVEQTRIKPQSIDTSFLVATLTAAIQEQQALITQLQADVAALKGASA